MDIFEEWEEILEAGEEPWLDHVLKEARKAEADRINRILIENGTVDESYAQHVKNRWNQWKLSKIQAIGDEAGVGLYLEFLSSQAAVAGSTNEDIRKNLGVLLGRKLTLRSVADSFRMVYLSVNF